MKETSPDGPYIDRLRSWAKTKVHGGNSSTARRPGLSHDNNQDHDFDPSLLPISNPRTNSTVATSDTISNNGTLPSSSRDALGVDGSSGGSSHKFSNKGPCNTGPGGDSNAATSPQASRTGSQLGAGLPSENEKIQSETEKPNVFRRFVTVFNRVVFHSWINILLVFVPVGIAVNFVPNMKPGVIFAMNAIAIIPLAGLLSQATETVAHRMGDAIGALLNITFGNAVELIILYVLAQKPPGDGLVYGCVVPEWDRGRKPLISLISPTPSISPTRLTNQNCSMYVCLAKVIKTRKREKPSKWHYQINRVPYP